MGRVLKYISVFGGVQGLNVLFSIVRNKLTSVLLGVGGVGLIDVYSRTADLIGSSTNFGLSFSAVQHIAELYGKGCLRDGQELPPRENAALVHYVKLVRSWVVLAALLGFLLTFLLSPLWAAISLGSSRHTTMVMALSPLVALLTLTGGELAVLRGLRRLKAIAIISSIGAFLAILITLPIYWHFGTVGIVPALVISAAMMFLMQLYAAHQVMPYRISLRSWRFLRRGAGMLRLGVGYICTGMICAACELLVRSFIVHYGNFSDVGIFAAGLTLTVTYTRLVFTSMDVEYFPRLSAAKGEPERLNLMVNRQIDVLTLLMAPLLMVFCIAIPLIIPLRYTRDFMEAVPMVYAAASHMFLKAISVPIGYLSLAHSESRLYLLVETSYSIVFLLLSIVGFLLLGVVGVGLALSLGNAVYLGIVWAVYARAYGFSMSAATCRRCMAQFALLLLGIGACAWGEGSAVSIGVAGIVALVLAAHSIRILKTEVQFAGRLRNIFRRRGTKEGHS